MVLLGLHGPAWSAWSRLVCLVLLGLLGPAGSAWNLLGVCWSGLVLAVRGDFVRGAREAFATKTLHGLLASVHLIGRSSFALLGARWSCLVLLDPGHVLVNFRLIAAPDSWLVLVGFAWPWSLAIGFDGPSFPPVPEPFDNHSIVLLGFAWSCVVSIAFAWFQLALTNPN